MGGISIPAEEISKRPKTRPVSTSRVQELNEIKKPLVESLLNLADLVDHINSEIKKLTNEYTR